MLFELLFASFLQKGFTDEIKLVHELDFVSNDILLNLKVLLVFQSPDLEAKRPSFHSPLPVAALGAIYLELILLAFLLIFHFHVTVHP